MPFTLFRTIPFTAIHSFANSFRISSPSPSHAISPLSHPLSRSLFIHFLSKDCNFWVGRWKIENPQNPFVMIFEWMMDFLVICMIYVKKIKNLCSLFSKCQKSSNGLVQSIPGCRIKAKVEVKAKAIPAFRIVCKMKWWPEWDRKSERERMREFGSKTCRKTNKKNLKIVTLLESVTDRRESHVCTRPFSCMRMA